MNWRILLPFLALSSVSATAQTTTNPAIPTLSQARSITLNGTPLNYHVKTGRLPIRNSDGTIECQMFSASYLKDNEQAGIRPVTFVFNGGPGSATLWLHMGGLGPKRAPMPPDGSLPAPPYAPVDSQETWLDFTDLVFIDAPGAGYSRLEKDDLKKKFYGVRQDISAFTEFIRLWLSENDRWASPLYIAGESYGGMRGSGLSQSLFGAGIAVNGFVSISGTNNFLTLDGMRGNDVTYLSFMPSMADCAWYHKKLPKRFTSVEQVATETKKWCDEVYGPALLKGDSLTDKEKESVATQLAMYLGLSKKFVLGSNLRVSEGAFFKELLREDRLAIGRYDGRLTNSEESAEGGQQSNDPSDDAVTAPFYSALNDYYTRDLNLRTDLKYLLFGSVWPWENPEGSYAETSTDLRNLIAANKHFRVMFCCGYYDLACPFNGSIYTVNHMGLNSDERKRVSFEYYPAGHMMYIEQSSRKKLHDDVKRFELAGLGQ